MKVMSRIVLLYLCLSGAIIFLSCRNKEPADKHSYTKWMTRPEFTAFMAEKEIKGEDGKNYWNRRHWADALESKWEGGYQKYRIAITQPPTEKYNWLWLADMDQKTFQEKLTENGMNGFRLAHSNKCTSPSGVESYAAVWQK